jgi:hypothetical protein
MHLACLGVAYAWPTWHAALHRRELRPRSAIPSGRLPVGNAHGHLVTPPHPLGAVTTRVRGNDTCQDHPPEPSKPAGQDHSLGPRKAMPVFPAVVAAVTPAASTRHRPDSSVSDRQVGDGFRRSQRRRGDELEAIWHRVDRRAGDDGIPMKVPVNVQPTV